MSVDFAGAARSVQELSQNVSARHISALDKQRAFQAGVEQVVDKLARDTLGAPSGGGAAAVLGGHVEILQPGQQAALGERLALALDSEHVHLSRQEIHALGASQTPAVAHLQKALQKALRSRELVAEIFREDLPGCAAVVVKNGVVIDAFGVGLDGPGGNPRTAGQRQHFASVSKQFTARLVLELEKDGKLNRSDDIRQHLPPGFPLPRFYVRGEDGTLKEVTITIDHLLHMESGLPSYHQYADLAGKKEADQKTTQDCLDLVFPEGQESLVLAYEPGDREYLGDKVDYQNINYLILAKIVEHRSEQPFREYADAKIFGPLGMSATHFVDPGRPAIEQTIRCFGVDEAGGSVEDTTPKHTIMGSTGVIGAPHDMAKWYGHLSTDPTARQLFQPRPHFDTEKFQYACGFLVRRRGPWNIVWHNGRVEGFRTESLFIEHAGHPGESYGVFLAANREKGEELEELCFKLADVWTGEHVLPPEEEALPTADVSLEESSWLWSEAAAAPAAEQGVGEARPLAPVLTPPATLAEFAPFVGTYHCPRLGLTYEMSVLEKEGQPIELELKLIRPGEEPKVVLPGFIPDREHPGQLCHFEEPKCTLRLGSVPGQVIFSDLARASIAELSFTRVE